METRVISSGRPQSLKTSPIKAEHIILSGKAEFKKSEGQPRELSSRAVYRSRGKRKSESECKQERKREQSEKGKEQAES